MSSRVLWVDDEWTALPEQVDYLRSGGMEVDCAASLQEGLDRVAAHKYAGVVLDMILPRGGHPPEGNSPWPTGGETPFLGLEFLDRIAELPPEARPAVLVVTIAADDRLIRCLKRWIKAGVVYDWLRKGPTLEFSEVAQKMAEAIQAREAHGEGKST